jgi:hypothetical protein
MKNKGRGRGDLDVALGKSLLAQEVVCLTPAPKISKRHPPAELSCQHTVLAMYPTSGYNPALCLLNYSFWTRS